jgi:hypothetical protein
VWNLNEHLDKSQNDSDIKFDQARNHNYKLPVLFRDVVGKPKGQGQDKQVLINRQRKNANKGKGHRIGADKKQAKGMF